MKRGRPKGSQVRDNIYSILMYKPSMYGYELHKAYCDLFENVTLRNIYYHLNKGVDEGNLTLHKSRVEKGDYSWGTGALKKRYSLAKKGIAKPDNDILNYFELRDKKKENNIQNE